MGASENQAYSPIYAMFMIWISKWSIFHIFFQVTNPYINDINDEIDIDTFFCSLNIQAPSPYINPEKEKNNTHPHPKFHLGLGFKYAPLFHQILHQCFLNGIPGAAYMLAGFPEIQCAVKVLYQF